MEKYIPDTSVIINGKFYEVIESGGHEVIIPESVISEIEAQANRGLMIGFTGLRELEKIRSLERDGKIKITFYGKRPERWQIERAKSGEIDDMIRLVALENGATLVTSDFVQASIARVKGIDVLYIETKRGPSIKIEDLNIVLLLKQVSTYIVHTPTAFASRGEQQTMLRIS